MNALIDCPGLWDDYSPCTHHGSTAHLEDRAGAGVMVGVRGRGRQDAACSAADYALHRGRGGGCDRVGGERMPTPPPSEHAQLRKTLNEVRRRLCAPPLDMQKYIPSTKYLVLKKRETKRRESRRYSTGLESGHRREIPNATIQMRRRSRYRQSKKTQGTKQRPKAWYPTNPRPQKGH